MSDPYSDAISAMAAVSAAMGGFYLTGAMLNPDPKVAAECFEKFVKTQQDFMLAQRKLLEQQYGASGLRSVGRIRKGT